MVERERERERENDIERKREKGGGDFYANDVFWHTF